MSRREGWQHPADMVQQVFASDQMVNLHN
jgi:hypothetical protein